MAALTQSSTLGPGSRTITPNTMTAGDTFTYLPGQKQQLVLYNPTAGALTASLGCGAATIALPGVPSLSVANYSSGSIAIGASKFIDLDTIAPYLLNGGASPTITITGGTGLVAWVLQGA